MIHTKASGVRPGACVLTQRQKLRLLSVSHHIHLDGVLTTKLKLCLFLQKGKQSFKNRSLAAAKLASSFWFPALAVGDSHLPEPWTTPPPPSQFQLLFLLSVCLKCHFFRDPFINPCLQLNKISLSYNLITLRTPFINFITTTFKILYLW